MLKKAAITIGVAGLLIGNPLKAQDTTIQQNPKTTTLDSLIQIHNNPKKFLKFVSKNIEVEGYQQDCYPQAYSEGFNHKILPSPDEIIKTKYVSCKEVFSLTAIGLEKMGYQITGVAIENKEKEEGHVFGIYKDTLTNLYGTTGLNDFDALPPAYDSIKTIIKEVGSKMNYKEFDVRKVDISEKNIDSSGKTVEIFQQYMGNIKLN